MLQWHRGCEAQQATHTCSLYLFLQMRTSSHTKQEQWNAQSRKEPSSFPQSGFDQHANVCSAVALRKVYIKLGKQCRRTKSCQAHDGAVWCGSTCSEEQGQQIQKTPPTNDTCLRVVFCRTDRGVNSKRFTRTAASCTCGNASYLVRTKAGV